ncbi:amylosucrase [Jatrophihabitans sp. GAS493]|uniref:alpha-amylase family protein n=1 Tax=Jatrophihabitans sp. GAS493 TaxID=1907575 RepID=UPI000BB6B184|nr:amylosucrase [Jatrophihabitans sp. GAS493]
MVIASSSIHSIATAELAGVSKYKRELFALRLDRWWRDLYEGLVAVYGEGADALAVRLVQLAANAYRDREAELHRLDMQRTLDPEWLQAPRMLGYATYTDRFADDLEGVGKQVEYLKELGVTYLHLLPLLRPRDGDNDGGYAVADYRTVRPDLGTMDDLRELATKLRSEGISLVLDLVLNHVAREHPWAEAARAGDPKYRAFFYAFDDRRTPDAYERTLPEVFPDFAPGNFTWDSEMNAWVWTTFNSWQWDVNWTNPDVFYAYADIILFLANQGVEVLRLDAIAFLYKRRGTDSQNQPEVHSITQALRAVARIAAPALAFKAEAIVDPTELVQYLGQGTHYGKVSELAYHNSLMVHIWSMLASRDVRMAAGALRALPPIPAGTAWITYVRCHDDIGWAISDRDADAAGASGPGHRAFLADYYSGKYQGSPGRGLVFQYNPATGDRRISGSLASLAGIDALPPHDAVNHQQAVDLLVGRILVAHAIAYGWGGVPVLWMGDELALPNDSHWAEDPAHKNDNRWVHRPKMPWDVASLRHDPASIQGRVFAGLVRLGEVRGRLPYLSASVPAEVLEVSDPGVLPVLHRHPIGPMLGLYNVTETWRAFPMQVLTNLGLHNPKDELSGALLVAEPDGNIWLGPYVTRWITSA